MFHIIEEVIFHIPHYEQDGERGGLRVKRIVYVCFHICTYTREIRNGLVYILFVESLLFATYG